jgi:hypothetical protein
MELSKLTGFHAAVAQAVTDKFIDRQPTETQLKSFVDVRMLLRFSALPTSLNATARARR